ncbi:cupin domain-containing protein [Chryseobacterium sp. WG14]|nr:MULTISPECIES: cupin domain-containing protein [unclassified Chryseobacterium]MCQ9636350.1 cupin domain-containing protein [Chryseobacterium sp. WG23]MCQ9641530.1 cupin domain-containing protein [Chryseobacterium sp. WG14]
MKFNVTFGIWEGTEGKWKFSVDNWEFCRILFGESIISDATTGKTLR